MEPTSKVRDLEARLAALEAEGVDSRERVDLVLTLSGSSLPAHPQRILRMNREARAIAERLGYKEGQAYCLGWIGFSLHLLSQHAKAREVLEEALACFERAEDRLGQAFILTTLVFVAQSLGRYEAALEHGLRATQCFQAVPERRRWYGYDLGVWEGWNLVGIGLLYQTLGDHDRALRYSEEALEVFERFDHALGEARALINIATTLRLREEYDRARSYYLRSLEIFRTIGERLGEARALDDLGRVYQHLDDPDRALQFYYEGLKIREEVGNRQAQSTSLINLAELCLAQDNPQEALDLVRRALSIAEDIKAQEKIYQGHRVLSEAHARLGDFEEALRHYRHYHESREAVAGEEARARINRLQTRFEVERAEQQAEIERLRSVELKQKNEQLERLLDELKATQAQLVQQEKMASLGQLTAGIAHEIKNPLNFVNNFAQMTTELLGEIREARRAEPDRTIASFDDLLEDLFVSADKIEEHGRRADRIVRNMMLHASGSSGEPRETDLNSLVAEYVTLAYHGVRVQQPDFEVEIEQEYDEAVGEQKVLRMELGRVLINLFNNAFYAIHRRRADGAPPGYVPRVTVRTRAGDEGVEIRVEDNGGGVPEKLRDRIFEPFFTTKPAGEGTGLGLSMSYDIVTRVHGGSLSVESQEGEGATFVVRLPASKE